MTPQEYYLLKYKINFKLKNSGLLFLRNYLRKKNANAKPYRVDESDPTNRNGRPQPQQQQQPMTSSKIFNSIPVPFPPRDDFYGPLYIPDELVNLTCLTHCIFQVHVNYNLILSTNSKVYCWNLKAQAFSFKVNLWLVFRY